MRLNLSKWDHWRKSTMHLLLCAGSVLPFDVTAGILEGIAAFDHGHYNIAVREIRPLAMGGNARAEYLYGSMLESGKIAAQPGEHAEDWYQRAATKGYAKAQYALARLSVSSGGAGSPTTDEAFEWLEKAAVQGHADAKRLLAISLLTKMPTSVQNLRRAVTLYTELAEQGDADAMVDLGDLFVSTGPWRSQLIEGGYAHGDEVALGWYMRAAKHGNPTGQGKVARMYELGQGVGKSDAAALAWYTKAAEQDDSPYQVKLAIWYLTGKGGVTKNPVKGFSYALKSAEQNDGLGMLYTGLCYAVGLGTKKDISKAYEWLSLAERNGEDAARHLGSVRSQLSRQQAAALDLRVVAWKPRENAQRKRQLRQLDNRSIDD